jgi:DNA replication and repair protein RecF
MIDRCGIESKSLADEVSQEEVAEGLAWELIRRTQDEYQRRVTLVGPHRDDVTFSIEGANARAFASQGQQRTIALAWKLAEVSVVRTVLSRTPVLLLDDVMSELDEDRRAALTGLIQQDIQTFVTTTNTTYFDPDLLQEAMVVHVGEQR